MELAGSSQRFTQITQSKTNRILAAGTVPIAKKVIIVLIAIAAHVVTTRLIALDALSVLIALIASNAQVALIAVIVFAALTTQKYVILLNN